uniref:ABC transporter ATP-binding protein n=1 Tax=Thermosporothrix sp. COM3 TaxID=2490863 RepID=A0A455SS97_9CHLR|nr:ABC transporter ATP-binding protein [Thermosporothrix sp. COM3]
MSSLYDRDVIIRTDRLTKAFGKLVAVNDLHLQVMRGDVFGFLGPNGSGKTTTIRMLLGLIRPTAGRAILFGMDTALQLSDILQRVGAIIETPVFYPYLSALDNLRVTAAASGMMSGKSNDRRLAEVLDIVDLSAYQKLPLRKYSLGMKQRLGIAAALLHDPELVLLDEPTNGLDPAGMVEIRRLIQRLAALGKTIFLSSHILNEVQQVCNRVAILRKGNLIMQGNVNELLQGNEEIELRLNTAEECQQALQLLEKARQEDLNWISYVQQVPEKDTMLILKAPASHSSAINAYLARHQLFAAELQPRIGSLEDLYLELTTPTAGTGHTGMEALASGPIKRVVPSKKSGEGKKEEV